MKLNLEKPVVFFDIESTGLNIPTDSIIELCFVKVFPDGERRVKTWRVCPWDYVNNCQRPIDPSAMAVHGITDDELKDEPKFWEIVDEVVEWLKDSELGGYNSQKFDLPMLAEEIERTRCYRHKSLDLDLHSKKMIDAQLIYFAYEPRNLKAAHRFYCGCDFENAHAAEADVLATVEVVEAQLDKYSTVDPDKGFPVLKNDLNALAGFVKNRYVDFAGRLILNDKGVVEVNFGKYKGKPAKWVYETDPSYFSWIDRGDFMLDTKHQFARLKEQFEKERREASKKPLSESETASAAAALQERFGTGKLF